MQTFLPFSDFEQSGRALDGPRLGKQRVEVIQIVRALTVPDYGWANHPAVLMWKGYEEALGRYGLTMCDVWVGRGFADTCADTIRRDLAAAGVDEVRSYAELEADGGLPGWLFDRKLTLSHQSSLLRKDPDHYRHLFPGVGDDVPYYWPVRSPAVLEREARQAASRQRRELKAAEQLRLRRSAAAKRGWATRTSRAGGGHAGL